LELNKIKHQEGMQVENLFYRSSINKIKKWLDKADDLSSREEENLLPGLYYKLWIFFNDGKTISISLDYYKNYSIQNSLVIGWIWRRDNIDKKELSNIQSKIKRQSFIESFNAIYKDKNFKIEAKCNGKYFNKISISKDLQLENLTERYFFQCLLDLSFAWDFVSNYFDS
jgi:hypothetical protein